jgi:hypothetical protein
MDQKVKQHRFLRYGFYTLQKVDIESFFKARIQNRIRSQTSGSGSGSDLKGPDPTGSGSATLVKLKSFPLSDLKKRHII